MKKLICFITFFFLIGGVFAEEYLADQTAPIPVFSYKKAKLYKKMIPGSERFILIADLHGTYAEMGDQYGGLLGSKSPYKMLELFYKQLTSLPIERDKAIHDFIYQVMLPKVWQETPLYQREMVQNAAKSSGLGLKKMILLEHSLIYTFFSHLTPPQLDTVLHGDSLNLLDNSLFLPSCSSLSAGGNFTRNHEFLIGRNFDWARGAHIAFNSPKLPSLLLITIYHPTDSRGVRIGNTVASLGYPGWFGTLTGMNDKGLFLELNSAILSSFGISFFDKNPPATYFDMLTNILFTANNYSDFSKAIANSRTNFPVLVLGADGVTKKMFVAEEVASPKAVVRMRVIGSKPYKYYLHDPSVDENMLLATNSFRLDGWDKVLWLQLPFPYLKPGNDDVTSRALLRYDNMLNWARANKGLITVAQLQKFFMRSVSKENGVTFYNYDLFSKDIVCNTLYSIIANPTEKIWYIREPSTIKGGKGDAWVTIDLKQFFAL